MTKVGITDTTFRDGHQSLLATRLRTDDMLPVASRMDAVGFHSMEVWGGATFDTTTRFLGEDPWERLRKFKEALPNTPLQMLLRGQALVGYRSYADDLVDVFVERSADNGIDVFRVFDALNDENNLSRAAEAVTRTGKHLQMAVCYSVTEEGKLGGPIFNLDYYVERSKLFEAMGADSVCIKDMAGLLAPYDAYELFSALKSEVSVPLQLHAHYTSGMASMTALKAIEAGCDVIDTALAPLALRTSQPAIEPIVMTLKGTENDLGFDLDGLIEIGDYLETVLPKYRDLMESPRAAVIDPRVWSHQIPGGMVSNLVNQLRETDSLDKLPEVLEEIPRTRRELGYPPLVTPMSQMVGTQAVSNAIAGRYELVSEEVKNYISGEYGRPVAELDPEVVKTVFNGTEPPKQQVERPASLIDPELDGATETVLEITTDIDDILIYALYPTTGLKFLRIKHGLEPMPDEMKPRAAAPPKEKPIQVSGPKPAAEAPPKSRRARTFNVYVGGDYYQVEVDPVRAGGRGVSAAGTPAAGRGAAVGNEAQVLAPMPGLLLRYDVEVGQYVQEGDAVAVLEAMKMENSLPAPASGTVQSLDIELGTTVTKGTVLAVIAR